MNKDYLLALEEIENEKGIPREAILDTLEKALIKSYEKNYDNRENVEVKIDRETGDIKVLSMREVVEDVEDPYLQISENEAQKISSLYDIGDIVPVELTPKNFGRIAAQTARNIVIQKIKDHERDAIYDSFINREKELINGTIQRIDNGNLFIDLGQTEGLVPHSEQVSNEEYKVNDRMKFFIKEVRNTGKGAQVILSRSSPDLITRLFELEVPEISDGTVEIHSIAREAGSRTKIAVFSSEDEIDPVGACVGYKGTRVNSIVEELNGEKIDIIVYSKDVEEFIANSLSPSDVNEVLVFEKEKTAIVVVPDDQLSLSIGKEGQNVRLAAKLTNWKIDIIGEIEYKERLESGTLEELYPVSQDDEDVKYGSGEYSLIEDLDRLEFQDESGLNNDLDLQGDQEENELEDSLNTTGQKDSEDTTEIEAKLDQEDNLDIGVEKTSLDSEDPVVKDLDQGHEEDKADL